MKTPEGWARANLLLQTLKETPKKGTLRESLLIMLMAKQETIEHARFRALSQIIIDSGKGVEAFEEYLKLAFPYLEATKKRDRKKFIDILKEEVSRGALRVRPMPEPKARSRLKQRVVAVDKRARERMDNVYQQIGEAFPIQ
jgi:hypothetical protein